MDSVSLADTYHGKTLPLGEARKLVRINEEITLPDLEQVIPYKRARSIVLKNPEHLVALNCPCRSARPNPCLPLDVCLVVGEPFASFIVEHHPGQTRWITPEEAVAILEAEDARGHVHHAFFKDAMLGRFYAICNCCACCCGAIHAHQTGTPMLASSGYVAEVDQEACIACGVCAENCQFGALALGDLAMAVASGMRVRRTRSPASCSPPQAWMLTPSPRRSPGTPSPPRCSPSAAGSSTPLRLALSSGRSPRASDVDSLDDWLRVAALRSAIVTTVHNETQHADGGASSDRLFRTVYRRTRAFVHLEGDVHLARVAITLDARADLDVAGGHRPADGEVGADADDDAPRVVEAAGGRARSPGVHPGHAPDQRHHEERQEESCAADRVWSV